MNALLRQRGIAAYLSHLRRGGVYVMRTTSGWEVRYRDLSSMKQELFFRDEASADLKVQEIRERPAASVWLQRQIDELDDSDLEEACDYWLSLSARGR